MKTKSLNGTESVNDPPCTDGNESFFMKSWKSWIFFKCTKLEYYSKTLNQKFQTPVTAGYLTSSSSGLESILDQLCML